MPDNIDDPANFPKMAYAMDTWPTDLFGAYPENREELGVLGIWSRFDRMGYNQYEIVPGEDASGTWTQKPIELPGRVKTIDWWLWGSAFNYYVEIYVMDYRGFEFKLAPIRVEKLTGKKIVSNLNYSGWRNFYIDIPNYIDQDVPYQPRNANMKITKFVIYTDPREKVTDCYLYMDHLKILTDVQESTFDGYLMKEKTFVEKVWGTQE
ncbi:MAG: flagellar filament outer layer protein FlaA [Spirochaetales bacterium]|nr:flagellar filament outer layer protein FlaA [Spirochaetales bacterium]